MTDFSPGQVAFIGARRKAALKEMGLASAADILVRLTRYIESVSSEILDERKLSELQEEGIKSAIADMPRSMGAIHDLIVDQPLSVDQREDLLFALAKLIDDALEIGFYHALDRESLQRSERIITGGKNGGQKGGRTRKSNADADAAAVATSARRIRIEHPNWSQDDVATEVAALWKGVKPPGHSKIKRIISVLENAGDLPKRRPAKSVNEGGSTS